VRFGSKLTKIPIRREQARSFCRRTGRTPVSGPAPRHSQALARSPSPRWRPGPRQETGTKFHATTRSHPFPEFNVSHRHGRKLDFPSTDRVKELLQSNTFISYRVLYGKSDWRPVRGWGGKSGGTEYWGNGHFRLETVGRCYGTDRRHRPKVSKQTFWFGSVAFCDDLEVNVVQPEGVELKVVDHTNVIIVFPNNCTKPSRGPFSIDNVTNRRIVCHQLDTWKMKVETAAGGGEALKMRSRCHRKAVQSGSVGCSDAGYGQLATGVCHSSRPSLEGNVDHHLDFFRSSLLAPPN
jgi:hypothetical protein